jgi:hypothetical protein
MTIDEALESLGYLVRSEDKVENLSFRMLVAGQTKSVEPMGYGVHSAANALTALVTATNVAKDNGIVITEVFFRRFEG